MIKSSNNALAPVIAPNLYPKYQTFCFALGNRTIIYLPRMPRNLDAHASVTPNVILLFFKTKILLFIAKKKKKNERQKVQE